MSKSKYSDVTPIIKKKAEEFKISSMLPSYVRTAINKKFMDTAVDTLFSSDKTENVSGYIGEKVDKVFNAKTDFYIPENSKQREDYQLTPATVITDGDGNIEQQFFYTDFINHIRYQGGNIDNYERLARQEYYSFSPLIDINKFINYTQYYWLDKGPKTIDFSKRIEAINYTENIFTLTNHGLDTGSRIKLGGLLPNELTLDTPYYVIKLTDDTFMLASSESNAINHTNEVPKNIDFNFIPSVTIDVFYETNLGLAIGQKEYTINGTVLSNGMVIRSYNDVLFSRNSIRYLVEGVGESIQLLDFDEVVGYDTSSYDSQPYDYYETEHIGDPTTFDYVTIQRGCKDGNAWSMRNRWFHISVLTEQELYSTAQARRPIIEFNRNIELYNFGNNYYGKIDLMYDGGNIQSITGLSTIEIDDVELQDGMTIIVKDDVEQSRNFVVYKVFGLDIGSLSLNPIGTLNEGDVVLVTLGNTHGGLYYHLSNGSLILSQRRINAIQDILFQLYDYEGNKLDDESLFPSSNFTGSKVFGYRINEDFDTDVYVQREVETNLQNDFMFENFLETEKYFFERDFVEVPIDGYYFFKKNGAYFNHWQKADETIVQGIIDETVISPIVKDDGTVEFPQIFELSQVPEISSATIQPIQVYLNGEKLEKDVDYRLTDSSGRESLLETKYISLSLSLVNQLVDGDLLKIKTYSSKTPIQPIKGFYEFPTQLVSLTGNVQNRTLTTFGRNDVIEHFMSVMERQDGFVGNPLGFNNMNNRSYNYGRGNIIIQNTASLLKVMAVNAYRELDVLDAMRYVENEYKRFYNKFTTKINELYTRGLDSRVSYIDWLNQVFEEIFVGKTSDFPFFNSGMANRDFVPPSPAFMGITQSYIPRIYKDTTQTNPVYMIRSHDGQLRVAYSQEGDFTNVQDFYTPGDVYSFVLTESIVFPWEIIVELNGELLSPYTDYTIFGGNSIIFVNNIKGNVSIKFVPDIRDRVYLFFEQSVYNNIPNTVSHEALKEYDLLEVKPGFFRNSQYTYEEYISFLEPSFNRWVSNKGYNPKINDIFDEFNVNTWNYSSLLDPHGNNMKGSWRAIFDYFYDTYRPNTHPWEMLGFSEKPSWWVSEYGNLPYTSDNTAMWQDIENGIIRNGPRAGTYEYLKRPGLSDYIPVDAQGQLLSVMEIFSLQEPNIIARKAPWSFGNIGPVEYEWVRSSHYSFAIATAMYLMKPGRFIDLFWDTENNYRLFKDQENSQLVSAVTKTRIKNDDIVIHNTVGSNGTPVFKRGIQQVLVDYLKYQGRTPETLQNIIRNANTRLGYKVGGFIDTRSARFVADNFGLVPNENFNVNIHKSASIKELVYSGIMITKTTTGYIITGYDTIGRRFPIILPEVNSSSRTLNVGGKQPTVSNWEADLRYGIGTYVRYNNKIYRCVNEHRSSTNFNNDAANWITVAEIPMIGGISGKIYSVYNKKSYVEYETELKTPQEILNTVYGYQKYLEQEGWVFDSVTEDGVVLDFEWATRQVFVWINNKPTVGDTITLSPLAAVAAIELDHGFIDQLTNTVNGAWSLISNDGSAIEVYNVEVLRDNENGKNKITIEIQEEETVQRLFGIRLTVKEVEHVVIFDNVTNFHDIIYDELFGLRQRRFKAFMNKSGDWTGIMKAGGYIIQSDGITSNADKSANDFRKYYDPEQIVIGNNFNLEAKKLVGFQPREYYDRLLFDERDAFQFYQGFLREKGTNRGLTKLLRNEYVQSASNVEIHEEWAVRVGSYGAIDAYSVIEINLDREDIKTNPQIVKFLSEGQDDPRNSIIELSPTDDRYIYKRPVNLTKDQFITEYTTPKMPNAGYPTLLEADFTVPKFSEISFYYFNKYGTEEIDRIKRIWVAETGYDDWTMYRLGFTNVFANDMELHQNENKATFTVDSSVEEFAVNDLVVINHPKFKTVLKVVAVDDETPSEETITVVPMGNFVLQQETFTQIFEILKLQKIRFNTIDEVDSFIPLGGWTNDDLVFIDNFNGKWAVYNPFTEEVTREQVPQIILSNLVSSKLYETETSIAVTDLIPYHPIQNVLPYTITKNVDHILSFDPANYNSPNAKLSNYNPETAWTDEKIGLVWWDLSTVKYLDYDAVDEIYRTNHWGKIFPDTSIDVYQWIRCPLAPSDWANYLTSIEGRNNFSPNSIPYSVNDYVVTNEYNVLKNKFQNYYYFWVKNNEFIPRDLLTTGKSLSTVAIQQQLLNPTSAGLCWFSPIMKDAFVVANTEPFLTSSTNLQVIFTKVNNPNNIHNEWYVFSGDNDNRNPPTIIVDKLRHSLVTYVETIGTLEELYEMGFTGDLIDAYGVILPNDTYRVRLSVPDDKITSTSQYGNSFRPRQTWFKDVESARESFINIVNRNLSTKNWVSDSTNWEDYLYLVQPLPDEDEYDIKVDTMFDRDNLIGTIGFGPGTKVLVEVDITNDGRWAIWQYIGVDSVTGENLGFNLLTLQGYRTQDYWEFSDFYEQGYSVNTVITKTYSTLAERNNDLSNLKIGDIAKVIDDGYGNFVISEVILNDKVKTFKLIGRQNGTFRFTNVPLTAHGAEAMDIIIRAYFDTLSTIRDKNSVIVACIQEALKQLRVVDWAFKTSFVDIVGLEEPLLALPVTKPDLSTMVESYFNELKPYHVKVRGFIERKLTDSNVLTANIEDNHNLNTILYFDRVACVANLDLPMTEWKAAERIANIGGKPEDEIPGCKFRGTEIDGGYFDLFENIFAAGYDINSLDSNILGYDFSNTDVDFLYDVVINGGNFGNFGTDIDNAIIDGGDFYQPLLSENRPPELAMLHTGDSLSFDVYTSSINIERNLGYDSQMYDNELDETGERIGYDNDSFGSLTYLLRPKMIQDLYVGGQSVYNLSQIPQSNEAIFVYLNDKLLSEGSDYAVRWDSIRPSIVFAFGTPAGSKIKILSYSVGGTVNTVATFFKKNISVGENVFNIGEQIDSVHYVHSLVNGVKVSSEWASMGATGLTNEQIRIPSAVAGDSVYIVVFAGEGFAELNTENITYTGSPYTLVASSNPTAPYEVNTFVYMNGRRLIPGYMRYFDPASPVTTFDFNELVRKKEFLKIYYNNQELIPSQYTLSDNFKTINMNFFVNPNDVILIRNDNNSDYHIENGELIIHTNVYGVSETPYVPNGLNLVVNGNTVNITRPDNQGTVPLDIGTGVLIVETIDFNNIITPTYTATLGINGREIIVTETDTSVDIARKINILTAETGVKAFVSSIVNNYGYDTDAYDELPFDIGVGSKIILRTEGSKIQLTGDWSIFGITVGLYDNAVSQIQNAIGLDYRVLSLDNKLKIINTTGTTLTLSSSNDSLLYFGLPSSNSITSTRVSIVTTDINTSTDMRTEIYEGNSLGEYPTTKIGYSEYSTLVSVLGEDSVLFSDFALNEINFGYEYYGYDLDEYDYSHSLGLEFKTPHNQSDTVVITTYNNAPREAPVAFRIFKNLRNEFSYYRISDENTTKLVQPLRPTDTELVVSDATVLPTPNLDQNIPGTIWIEGELIHYFEVNTSNTGNHVLSKLVRGVQGTPFGYVNERIMNGNIIVDQYIKTGTLVRDFANQKFNMKNPDKLWIT